MKQEPLSFIHDIAQYGKSFKSEVQGKYDVDDLVSLIKDCTSVDPAARPDFKAICERLWTAIISISIIDPFSAKGGINCTAGGRDPHAHRKALRGWWERAFQEEDGKTSLSVRWDTFIAKFYEMSEISSVPLNLILLIDEYKETRLKVECLRALVCEGGSDYVNLDHFSKIACRLGPFDLYAKRYFDRVRELLGFNAFYGDATENSPKAKNSYLLRFSSTDFIAYTISREKEHQVRNWRISGRFCVNAEGRVVFKYEFLKEGLRLFNESIVFLTDGIAREFGLVRCMEYPYEYLFREKSKSKYEDAYA